MKTLLFTMMLFLAMGCDCLPIVQRTYRFYDLSECELRTANAALEKTSEVLEETRASLQGMRDELKTANKRLEALDRLVKRFESLQP